MGTIWDIKTLHKKTMANEVNAVQLAEQGTRLTFAGSGSPYINVIDYIETATTGNAIDFGDLSVTRGYVGGAASTTRGVLAEDIMLQQNKMYWII